jgi:hypothetical protein
MENHSSLNHTINLINNEKNIADINNDILELTNLMDMKIMEIYDINENNNNKILSYKLLLENIILEYHKICKELFKND